MKSSKVFKTVFFDTLKRYLPVSSAYWGVMLFFYPCIELFIRLRDYLETIENSMIADTDYAGLSHFFQVFVVGGASIVFSSVIAFIAFSYLHSKRQMDFIGALPINRRTQFFGRLSAVIALVIVPMIVCTFLGTAAVSFHGFEDTMMIMLMMGLVLIANIFFIGFIAVCSGTVAQMIVSFLLINFAYPILMLIVGLYPSSVFPGVESMFLSGVTATLLSPITAVFGGVGNALSDNILISETTEFNTGIFRYGTSTVAFCIWWAVLAVALALGSYFLIKRRKTERAQTGYAFSVPNTIIRFVVSLVAGFIFGIIMGLIFSASYLGKNYHVVLYVTMFVIGFVIGTALADFLIHLIYNAGTRGYLKKLPLLAAEIVIGLLFFFGITTDFAGYADYAPDVNEVESIDFSYDDFYDDYETKHISTNDIDKIQKTLEVQQSVNNDIVKYSNGWYIPNHFSNYTYEDIESSENNTYYSIKNSLDNSGDIYNVTIKYNLKNGDTVTREYTDSYSSIVNKYEEKLCSVLDIKIRDIQSVNVDDLYGGMLYLNESSLGYTNSYIYFESDSKQSIEDLKNLMEAIKKDNKLVGDVKVLEENNCCMLEYGEGDYYYTEVIFDDSYKNTMKFLKEYLKENKPLNYDDGDF